MVACLLVGFHTVQAMGLYGNYSLEVGIGDSKTARILCLYAPLITLHFCLFTLLVDKTYSATQLFSYCCSSVPNTEHNAGVIVNGE